jgi:hypothetical protein
LKFGGRRRRRQDQRADVAQVTQLHGGRSVGFDRLTGVLIRVHLRQRPDGVLSPRGAGELELLGVQLHDRAGGHFVRPLNARTGDDDFFDAGPLIGVGRLLGRHRRLGSSKHDRGVHRGR